MTASSLEAPFYWALVKTSVPQYIGCGDELDFKRDTFVIKANSVIALGDKFAELSVDCGEQGGNYTILLIGYGSDDLKDKENLYYSLEMFWSSYNYEKRESEAICQAEANAESRMFERRE